MLFQDCIDVERAGLVMVQHLQMTSASINVYQLIDTNIVILSNDGSVILTHIRDPIPDFLLEMQQKDFLLLGKQIEQDSSQCYMNTNELGLTYLSKLIEFEGDDAHIWFIGPFLMQMPDLEKLDSLFHTDQNKRNRMQEFIRSLKLFSNSKIQSVVNILSLARSIRQIPYQIVNLHQDPLERGDGKTMMQILQQPDESDSKFIELKYELEKEIMHAVEKGDKTKIKKVMSEGKNWHDFSKRFPNQPVRAMRNMLIILNTLLRIAAEKGKVPPFFLHHISEKFSKQIERSESINSLNSLQELMQDEYCDLVKAHAISGYSKLVQQAAKHIKIHFSKPLNLKQLAEYCVVHPAHLSRQFKKETGMTLTDYQNKMRIDEAKLLLREGRTSIDRIAGYIGFDDAGYFARIFKKIEGMTPTQFRNSC
ncbi:YesN/AraC family two-component response regulator [Paenibacillus castaneae]|uniref:AraC family transcriptional regulator n=1 Tax=Paenibacillus castaneae TaxID=474957 RepID=UPI000C9C7B59|nr:AraC family transcriptional regulator [Paenibacillus castaneae]NIK75122.1 YesN/AraC family two-component response regulator [Paenibacillus castaneae]